jgi:prophage tail gpP-like protein
MIEIRVNGTTYNLFKQVDLTSSLDEMLKECKIVVTEAVNDSYFINEGDLIEIWLDGVKAFTGYTDDISETENDGFHDISFGARSKGMDVIDSTVPDKVKFVKKVQKYKDLWTLCIDGLGVDIKVIDEVGATFTTDDKGAEVGEHCGDFLQKYARKIQVFPTSDGNGDIVIRRPGGKLKTLLLNVDGVKNNNIIDSTYSNNISERFNKYVVRSNGNLTSASTNDKALKDKLNAKGEYIDEDVREGRFFEKPAESPMTASECKKAAEEEANIRKIRGFNYVCEVSGFSGNGELWEDGLLVDVKDNKKGIVGEYVIKNIHYSYSQLGEKTVMNLTYPDAYGAMASTKTYTVKKGDYFNKIAKNNEITLGELLQANPDIKKTDYIYPDQQINIPVRSIK